MHDLRMIMALVTKREIAVMAVLSGLFALSEGFSVSMLLPIFQSIQFGGDIFDDGQLPPHLELIKGLTTFLRVPASLAVMLLLAFAGVLLRQGFFFLRTMHGARVQERVSADLRTRGFSALIHSDLGFLDSRQQGRLHSVLVADAPRSASVAFNFLRLISSGFLPIGYAVLLVLLSPALALVALGASVITFAALRFVSQASWRHGAQISLLNGELNSALSEKLSGAREVKLVNQEEAATSEVRGIARRLATHLVRLRALATGVQSTVEPMMIASGFVTLLVAVEFLQMPLANVVVFMFILLRIIPLTRELILVRQQISSSMPSLVKTKAMIEEAEASTRIVGGSRWFEGLGTAIEFDQVSFRYGDDDSGPWALRDVTTVIPKGSFTALVGKSGAGKSTFASLIPRLHDVSAGEIRVDGIPLKDFSLESLRPAVGFVSQDIFLFNDTVANNLTYGLSEVSAEAVRQATERAYAYDFIQELPQGFDTPLGDRGVRLSAGQRQRLSIARAMLHDPQVLILDEPTSARDSESELYVQRGLDDLRHDKTVLVIAHRLSTIQRADNILVLDGGRLVENGDHRSLVERDGTYRRLFDLQMIGG